MAALKDLASALQQTTGIDPIIGISVLSAVVAVVVAVVWRCRRQPDGPLVPRRRDAWLEYTKTEKYKSQNEKCKKKLKEIKDLVGDEQLKLLAIGRQGVGKSSFLNAVMKACDETGSSVIQQVFLSAQSDNHVSQRFTGRNIRGTKIFLVDSIGVRQLGEGQFTYDNVWDSLFQGIVDVGATVEYVENFDDRDSEGRLTTARGTPYDGAILVEDSAESMGDGGKLAFAKKIAETRGRMSAPIPIVGVVTKIDNLCSNFRNFVELAEKKEVVDPVSEIERQLNVSCYGVRCYDETFKYNDPWINYTVLDALHYIVEQAMDFKQRKEEESQNANASGGQPKFGRAPSAP